MPPSRNRNGWKPFNLFMRSRPSAPGPDPQFANYNPGPQAPLHRARSKINCQFGCKRRAARQRPLGLPAASRQRRCLAYCNFAVRHVEGIRLKSRNITDGTLYAKSRG